MVHDDNVKPHASLKDLSKTVGAETGCITYLSLSSGLESSELI